MHHQFLFSQPNPFPLPSLHVSANSGSCLKNRMSPALATTMAGQPRCRKNNSYDHNSLESMSQKGVKNMFETGIKHVPNRYILPPSDRPNLTTQDDELKLRLPIIDFEELQGPNRSQVLQSLAYACKHYGFFQLVNHGVEKETIADMVDASTRFFSMPLSEREKYMSADSSLPVRYGTSFNQTNDGVFSWRDFLKLVCHPLPDDLLPYWPSSPSNFSQLAVSYAKITRLLFLMLAEAVLESLGLKKRESSNSTDDSSILPEELFEDGSQVMILNCYPPCPQPDLTLGMPPHSDYGFLTLLLQDEVEGLQIQHQDRWVTVRPVPGSFVVNVGDHLEIFSNGKYKSVLHRAVVNSTKCRISVASLHSVAFTRTVRPAAELVTEENPRRYKDTDFATFLEYIRSCDSKEKNFLHSRKLF